MVGAGENFIVTKDNMAQLREQLQTAIREVPNFDKLKNHIDMTVTSEGLRIELTESASGTFYDSGSAKLNADGQDLLKILAQELGKLPNKIAIEGHTDSKPHAEGSNYGHWELSADRANAARRLMQQNDLGDAQVTQVRGFADQRLRKPDAPLDPADRHFVDRSMYDQARSSTAYGGRLPCVRSQGSGCKDHRRQSARREGALSLNSSRNSATQFVHRYQLDARRHLTTTEFRVACWGEDKQ
jgi:outer membrane protein OmpA-like peptidoglycan-associated protein